MNYFVHIAFDGSNYSGWQRQANVLTVQELIESKLAIMFKRPITIFGCGRTDTGVHASQYVFHFTMQEEIDFDLVFRLNKHLPNSIVAYESFELSEECHARHGAKQRTYDYFFHTTNDPVLHKYSTKIDWKELDVTSMQEAAKFLTTIQDFKAVCRQPELHNHTLCQVSFAELFVNESQDRFQFKITANRFLRSMIRLIIMYLLKVGRRELSVAEFEAILIHQTQIPENRPAPPNGLFLSKIEYPFVQFQVQKDISTLLRSGLELK